MFVNLILIAVASAYAIAFFIFIRNIFVDKDFRKEMKSIVCDGSEALLIFIFKLFIFCLSVCMLVLFIKWMGFFLGFITFIMVILLCYLVRSPK